MNHDNTKNHTPGYIIYLLVWFGLLILTGVTVSVAGMNIGRFTVATALLIATIKTYFVLTIFMHLKSESKTFKVFVGVSIFFLLISFALLFSDYGFK